MKQVIFNIALFIVFSIAFSGLAACGSNEVVTGVSPASNTVPSTADSVNAAKSANYPPLVSNIAQADLELLDGSTFKTADRKGKVLLLNLWGIWCGPCRAEMPKLVELQDKYRDKGFQVIGLNVGNDEFQPENIDNINKFAEKLAINYELARIPRSTTDDFMKLTKFGGIPQTVLVDREGRLRGVFLGGREDVIEKMKETVDKVVNE